MRRDLIAAAIATVVLSAPAFGQDFAGAWIWSVTTDNGDSVVEPGETATILLSIDFDPNVFEKGKTGELMVGLAFVHFDTVGATNADRGSVVDWFVHSDLAELKGDQTTTDGVSLFGTLGQQGFGQLFSTDDPIDILSFEWTTDDFSGYDVHYATSMLEPLLVWEGGNGKNGGVQVEWDTIEADVVFHVVPAPAAALALAGLGLRRRRPR